ncbi:MAG: hypothetical protein H3C64_10420 [Candidatus Kuenenia stuttgartiensis]|jgi:hypothetical protein|uniref:Uncharacterized protein n=1 Tax=Kuenenia stuttgartiensis TaxID=174633 RepID=A0A2C9CG76_KUEST|nr:hypothetical protein [Candidatus Kuenenia stuttgartiensis]MBE7545952.1 hypothetical protein [Planctomycetia bacterium]MBW7942780.1 hypothetical protein [Candidatus Kuenenia stuttgartiensis]MBZ0193371.1 hypothetical protein [Candidatus Kuenenia stuttgartiensis]MCL4728056.1 hypothetical protein [Candidatus Kuenenia stuttgartiensis]SOH04899.1 hypothetical protein KSMBR1_2411 [Candidatus Kuenenia stuttgartiensis]
MFLIHPLGLIASGVLLVALSPPEIQKKLLITLGKVDSMYCGWKIYPKSVGLKLLRRGRVTKYLFLKKIRL